MRTRKKLLSLGLALAMLTIYTVAPVAAIGNAISGGMGPDVQAQILGGYCHQRDCPDPASG